MPKKTKRKTGDTFIFTTSKAMGKRIREHCAKTGQPVGPWIRSVVAREVSPNLPRESIEIPDEVVRRALKYEIYNIMAEDVTPERERPIEIINPKTGDRFRMIQSVEQWASTPTKVFTRTCDGRVRIDKVDAKGLVVESEFISPDKMTTFT